MKAKKPRTKKGTNKKTERDAKKVEITVKIGAFPGGKIKPYLFPEGSTYEQGLEKAQLKGTSSASDQLDVRVNGAKVTDLTSLMKDGDQILVFTKVRGN